MTPFQQYVKVLTHIEPFNRVESNSKMDAGGMRNRTYWSKDELQILKDHYNPKDPGNLKDLFRMLPKRSVAAISEKIKRELLKTKIDPRGTNRKKRVE